MAEADLLQHLGEDSPGPAPRSGEDGLFVEGETCWRLLRAHRVAFLIDAAAYFSAFKAAALRARRSIIIVGWDVDSRVRLEPDRDDVPAPDQLGEFLDHLVANRPGLHVHVLAWDFPIVFAGDRELFTNYRLGLMTHRRLRYCLDAVHPVGACHHQKIVVIDDALAFIGGIDFGSRRWDTPEHRLDDPRRTDASGQPYPPFHDMQVALDGEAAAALGQLARERWLRATGKKITRVAGSGEDLWPEGVGVDLHEVDVAIARTDPGIDGLVLTREVEALYLASVERAESYIYIENQYFTAGRVAAALAESLERDGGPEVVLVLPQENWDWLEQATMSDRRAKLIAALRRADRHGRLRVLCPLHRDVSIHVHAKLMISDDRLVRIGSANLSNRSMGLDSECDIAFEAEDGGAVRHLLARLVGEHTGAGADEVEAAVERTGSLVQAIDELDGQARRLAPIEIGETELAEDAGLVASSQSIVDPEAPAEAETLIGRLVRAVDWRVVARHLVFVGLGIGALVALALFWRMGPLPEWLDTESLAEWWKTFGNTPLAALVTAATFVIAGFAMVPLTVLITSAAIAFGPVLGSAYAFAGAMLSAIVDYGLGVVLGQGWARRLLGPRWRRIGDALSGRGALAIALVRMVPVAPYTVVNFLAGAVRVRLLDFALGTALGLAPGILALSILGGQIGAVLRKPDWLNVGVLVAITLLLMLGLGLGVRWLHRRHGQRRRRRLAARRS
ncbi:MAG: VTT domain-containing protein [Rhodospirillales bacterium]|nr:VTT domain-containing protein [Rhodospirillales bacterium]